MLCDRRKPPLLFSHPLERPLFGRVPRFVESSVTQRQVYTFFNILYYVDLKNILSILYCAFFSTYHIMSFFPQLSMYYTALFCYDVFDIFLRLYDRSQHHCLLLVRALAGFHHLKRRALFSYFLLKALKNH